MKLLILIFAILSIGCLIAGAFGGAILSGIMAIFTYYAIKKLNRE